MGDGGLDKVAFALASGGSSSRYLGLSIKHLSGK
jgi:hypothetical protein